MDLIYGNDGMNYRVFAKSDGISQSAEQQLQSGYMKYYFVKNPSAYSRGSMEPESIYYRTTNLGEALAEDYAIFAKNGRMTQRSTPSFYFHAHLEPTDGDFFKERFFRMFRMKFISDLDAPEMDQQKLSTYIPETDETIREGGLSLDQVRMILYLFFHYERIARPVKIILDEGGDGYNHRAREVLLDIYRYLPYDFRKRWGFLSYMDEEQASAARIGFELFDRTQLKNPSSADIDLVNSTRKAVQDKVRPELVTYVDYITGMDENERTSYFDELERLTGGAKLSVQDCISLFTFEKEWKEKPVEDLLPIWVDYIFKNERRGGAVYEKLKNIIAGRMDNETYNNYLKGLVRNQNAWIISFPEQIRQTIVAADAIEGISFDEEWFINRESARINMRRYNTPFERRDSLRKEIEAVDKLRLGSEKFEPVLQNLKQFLSYDLNESEEEVKEEEARLIRTEKARLSTVLDNTFRGKDWLHTPVLLDTYCSLDYEELKAFYRGVLSRKVMEAVELLARDSTVSMEELKKTKDTVRQLTGVLEQRTVQECLSVIKTEEEKLALIELQNCKEMPVSSRKDLLKLIEELCRREQLVADKNQLPSVKMLFQAPADGYRMKLELSGDETRALISFLAAPDDSNYKDACCMLQQKINIRFRELLNILMGNGLFDLCHAPYLRQIASDLRDRELAETVASYYRNEISRAGIHLEDNQSFANTSPGKPKADPHQEGKKRFGFGLFK